MGDVSATYSGRRKARGRRGLTLLLVAVLLVGGARPGYACTPVLTGFASSAYAAIVAKVAASIYAITTGFGSLYDPVTRYANQTTNTRQNQVGVMGIMSDRRVTTMSAVGTAESRLRIAQEMAQPSRVACRQVTSQVVYKETWPEYSDLRVAQLKPETDFSLNRPGTTSERGTLAALSSAWQYRCSKYADVTNMMIPSGVTCAGGDPAYIDMDTKPAQSIFEPIVYPDAQHEQAAADTIRMLIQVAPGDPLRGPALSRVDGQNLHVERMQNLTRMNLARGVLQDAVAMRTRQTTALSDGRSGLSRMERLRELMTGRTSGATGLSVAAQMDQIQLAAQPENANVQSYAARLAGQRMLLLELIRMTEQMVALEAVRVAVRVEENPAGTPSLAARVVQ